MEIPQLPTDCLTFLLVLSICFLQKYLLGCIFLLIQNIPHLILTHLYLPLRFLFLFGRGNLCIPVVTILLQVSSVDFALVIAYFFVDLLDSLVHLIVTLRLFLAGLVVEVPICDSELGLLAFLHWFGVGVDLHGIFLLGFFIFGLVGLAGLALKTSPYLLLVFAAGIDWHFLVATGRDALDEPTDLIINRIDLLKVLALFGLQWRKIMLHLIYERRHLSLLLLLGLLSYEGGTFIFCSSKLLRSEKEGSRYLIAQPLPKVSPRQSGTSVTSDWKMDFYSIQRPLIVYIKFCTYPTLGTNPTQSPLIVSSSISNPLKVKQLYSYNFITTMDALLREKMTQLTSKCQILQKNGKYEQCIDIMEQIVSIKKNIYGLDHAEFQTASEKLCEYLNLAAMIHLQKENFQRTLEYLKKAEIVARESIMLKATTFNNLACYYRRTGKVKTAFSYLIKALELELKLDQPRTLADTHLNLCAVLSQLDRHEDALQHSMLSIILLQDEFLSSFLPKIRAMGNEEDINDERLAVLAIAYHNLGVQFQHLKRYEEALKIYRKALAFSKENLSSNEQLVKNLSKVVNSATQQIQEQKQSLLASVNKTMVMKEGSAFKHDFYKDLSKKNDRYRPLPKLKVNTKEHAALYEPSYQSVDYNEEEPVNASKTLKNRQKFISQRATTKQQNAITPDSRGQLDSQLKVRAGMNMTSHSKEPDLEQ